MGRGRGGGAGVASRSGGVVVVATAAAAALTLSSCGNYVDMTVYDYRGGLALGMDGNGDVIVHIEACQYRVTAIPVVQGRELLGGEPNPRLGHIVTDQPQTGRFEVNLSNPQAPWRAEQQLTEPPDPGHIMIVSARTDGSVSQKKEVIGQESASRTVLEALAPGEVVINVWNEKQEPGDPPLRDEVIRLDEFRPECPE